MTSSITSLGLVGLRCYPVTVEADVQSGISSFDLVGLPGAAVRESRDRVRASIQNCGLTFPAGRIVINLAPADQNKDTPIYDLPVLLALLCASGQLPPQPQSIAFLGELSLTGELRPVKGVLPMVRAAAEIGIRRIYVPEANAVEAALEDRMEVYGAATTQQLIEALCGRAPIPPAKTDLDALLAQPPANQLDFSEVRGQDLAKRALEIAAAGGHNLMMIGPPGAGKSMLAKRLPSILPPFTRQEALEVTAIHSVAGLLPPSGLVVTRPFRAPHHTMSDIALAGGGRIPRPGEVSLAHAGVLFLDELPEFGRSSLEVLRQPIEDGRITVSRVSGSSAFPSRCSLVAALNPCPCGYFGHPSRTCTCSQADIARYLRKISGPLLDRIDLQIEVSPVTYDEMTAPPAECSAAIRRRVVAARERQLRRFEGQPFFCNAGMEHRHLVEYCTLSGESGAFLRTAFERLDLSARSYDRLCKTALTIADLEGADRIAPEHLAEAIRYRALDQKYWRRRMA
ncbi:MAG: YifB family Mg chelatase-like AAA ATPase [Clostridiales bacterium]|nr:YifB family Mg chelatase-like AAA ATPase [Clostridiales bacterium]